MSRWGEAFAALSRPHDTMDTVDTVEAAPTTPAVVSHIVNCVTGRMGGDRESGPRPAEQPLVVYAPTNSAGPCDPAGPTGLCPFCSRGDWRRRSSYPTGGPPGPWQCHRCDPLPADVYADACAVPVRLFPAIRKLPAAWPDPTGSVCTTCRRVSAWRADAPAGPSPCVLTWRCTGCAARTAAPGRPGGAGVA